MRPPGTRNNFVLDHTHPGTFGPVMLRDKTGRPQSWRYYNWFPRLPRRKERKR
jgi:hypothetical protein